MSPARGRQQFVAVPTAVGGLHRGRGGRDDRHRHRPVDLAPAARDPSACPGKGGLFARQPRVTLLVVLTIAALGGWAAYILRRRHDPPLGRKGALALGRIVLVVLAVIARDLLAGRRDPALGRGLPDLEMMNTAEKSADEKAGQNRSFFMDIYASMTREYMRQSGATAEDFADVAVKSHDQGALNPKAQYRNRCTREEVLASREISPPLTLMMCSPIGDGAAAAILCSEKVRPQAGARPSRCRSRLGAGLGPDRKPDEPGAAERAAKRAYEVPASDRRRST